MAARPRFVMRSVGGVLAPRPDGQTVARSDLCDDLLGAKFCNHLLGKSGFDHVALMTARYEDLMRCWRSGIGRETCALSLEDGAFNRTAGIPILNSETAVVPAICGGSLAAVDISLHCFAAKILAAPITFPAVQKHVARLRLTPCANHSIDDLELVVDVLVDAFDKVGSTRGDAELLAAE